VKYFIFNKYKNTIIGVFYLWKNFCYIYIEDVIFLTIRAASLVLQDSGRDAYILYTLHFYI
jgi:hypothetical protein